MRVCPFSQYEAKTKLESLSGNSSISSADLFGDGSDHKGRTRKSAEMQQMWPRTPEFFLVHQPERMFGWVKLVAFLLPAALYALSGFVRRLNTASGGHTCKMHVACWFSTLTLAVTLGIQWVFVHYGEIKSSMI